MSIESKDCDVLFASDLGWKAGEWPETLWQDDYEYCCDRTVTDGSDLICAFYRPVDSCGRMVKVYNDE